MTTERQPRPAGRFGWTKILTVSCQDAVPLISEALDRPLPGVERTGLRLHLLICRWCRRYHRQLHWLRRFARHPEHNPESLPVAALSAEARERLRDALRLPGDAGD